MSDTVLVSIIMASSAVLSTIVTVIGAVWVKKNVWSARDQSHGEHAKTAKKIDEIHIKVNGGLDARIEEKVREILNK